MKQKRREFCQRALALILSFVMVITVLPMDVLAASVNTGSLATDMNEKDSTENVPKVEEDSETDGGIPENPESKDTGTLEIIIGDEAFRKGETKEFSIKMTANEDIGTMVQGSVAFSDPDAVEKLEYLESEDNQWYEFTGDFGTGDAFSMEDAIRYFRVTFNKSGEYTVTASINKADGSGELCSAEEQVIVENWLKVSAAPVSNGEITLNGQQTETLSVIENSEVAVCVKPDTGHRISSVMIGGVEQELISGALFEKNIQISVDTEIVVTFTKTYTITVKQGENGVIETTPVLEGGKVVVDAGEAVDITAIPNENYRVSEVIINNVAQTLQGENGESFEKSLEADKDYIIEVAFALNRYAVSVGETENGTVELPTAEAEYGSSVKANLIPMEGYVVKSVKIDNKELMVVTPDDKTAYVEISDITGETHLEVVFKEIEEAAMDNVVFNSKEALRTDLDKSLYVYEKNKKVEFSTGKLGIALYDCEGKQIAGNWDEKIISITETTTIGKISLYYQEEGDAMATWHDVSAITSQTPIHIVIDDTPAEAILIPEEGHYTTEYYNSDFSIDISVDDTENGSGIAMIECWVIEDGAKVLSETWDLTKQTEGSTKFKEKWEGSIEIIAAEHNSCDIKVFVRTWDNAGNEWDNSENPLKINHIDTIAPTIDVRFDDVEEYAGKTWGEDGSEKEYGQGYFGQSRTAIVEITEKTNHFEKKDVKITVTDFEDQPVEQAYEIGEWTTLENEDNPDLTTHTAKIFFKEDANYKWSIAYTDKAGNKATDIDAGNSVSPWEFTVDTTDPEEYGVIVEKNIWTEVLEKLTFGLYSKDTVEVKVTATDATSPIVIDYLEVENPEKMLSETELQTRYENKEFKTYKFEETEKEYKINADKQLVTYFRVTDYAGNYVYMGTDGLIVERKPSNIALAVSSDASGSCNHTEDEGGPHALYKEDVTVDISVEETDEPYSGIQKIEYWVENKGVKTQGETLYFFDYTRTQGENSNGGELKITDWDSVNQKNTETVVFETTDHPKQGELKQSWQGSIVVDAEANNSCDVKVVVKTVDNAGNSKEAEITLDIDSASTAPAIDVSFDDVKEYAGKTIGEDESQQKYGQGYFAEPRTATVVITERAHHFNAENVVIDVTAAGKDVNRASYLVSAWETQPNTENPDLTTHTAKIFLKEDANYTWSIAYTDKAGNEATDIDAGNSASPWEFTIDTKKPEDYSVTIEKNIWNRVLEVLTFGLYSNKTVEIKADATDASPLVIDYLEVENPDRMLTETELETKYKNEEFRTYRFETTEKDYQVNSDKQFVTYFRVTDYAGNYVYMGTDGFIVDQKACKVELKPLNASGECMCAGGVHALYNDDVTVEISVEEEAPYSGIKTIEYWVTNNEEVTQEATTLYSFDYIRTPGENSNGGQLKITDWDSEAQKTTETVFEGTIHPTQLELKQSWQGSIVVDAEANNSCDVKVFVKTTDNAGNPKTEEIALDIDIEKPKITVSFDNNKDNKGNTYFDDSRTATIKVEERSHHFDKEQFVKNIEEKLEAVNAKDENVEGAYEILKDSNEAIWTTVEDAENTDKTIHEMKIKFGPEKDDELDILKDANFKWEISYTDRAANETSAEDVKTGNSAAPWQFTVDTTKPFGTIKAESGEGNTTVWKELREKLTFNFWSKSKISVSAAPDDDTSPIAKVESYKVTAKNPSEGTKALTYQNLDALPLSSWGKFDGLTVETDEQFTVYLKITDKAGNYHYIGTNGLIVDHTAPQEMIAPEITITPEQPINGIYNRDVMVDVKVVDPVQNGTYSGLKNIRYEIKNMGKVTQSGTFYSFEYIPNAESNANAGKVEITDWDSVNQINTEKFESAADPAQEELRQSWEGRIKVDSGLNNSNDVEICIYAADNAENGSESIQEIQIDITKPKIEVSYDNNKVDRNKYFKENRTATIEITERNFDPKDVIIDIKNTEGVIPSIGKWTKVEGTGNLDNTKWSTTLIYDTDGDYTFDIEFKDLAGNACDGAQYGDSVAPTEFTIDKTLPKVTVTYDNMDARNGNYYKESRTATIVIREHNLDPNGEDSDRVKITMTATDDGVKTTVPSVSSWRRSGDEHTATIHFKEDALYTFDIDVMDKAGNESEDYAEDEFYIDQTEPTVEFAGVENFSANKGDVIPIVSYFDTNYDAENVTITLTGANRKEVELVGSYSNIHNGRAFTFKNFLKEKEIDDIYVLKADVTDKAGNNTTEEIVFSVNRFGSTYALSKETEELNNTYTKEPINAVIYEVNVDELKNIEITMFKNNETLTLNEGIDYVISREGGNGEWYRYTYTVFAKNFEDEGVYRLLVSSEDAAGNLAENTLDTKNMEIGFGVDKTNPMIVVANLESEITYALDRMDVKMSVKDNLLLNSVEVYLDDYEKVYKTWTAEEISKILAEGGEFTFDIAGDSTQEHNLKIVCKDAADNTQIEEITGFFVTTNLWVRYYNNKPLFYGSICGVLTCIGVASFVITKKKKRQEVKAN